MQVFGQWEEVPRENARRQGENMQYHANIQDNVLQLSML